MIDKAVLDMLGEAAQKYGMQRFECEAFKVTFMPQQPRLVISSEDPKRSIGEAYGMPTEDQLLFASSIPLTEDELAARAPA